MDALYKVTDTMERTGWESRDQLTLLSVSHGSPFTCFLGTRQREKALNPSSGLQHLPTINTGKHSNGGEHNSKRSGRVYPCSYTLGTESQFIATALSDAQASPKVTVHAGSFHDCVLTDPLPAPRTVYISCWAHLLCCLSQKHFPPTTCCWLGQIAT